MNQASGEEERVEADAVVLSLGATPVNGLAKDLEDNVERVFVVGDCFQPRKIYKIINFEMKSVVCRVFLCSSSSEDWLEAISFI